MKKTNPRFLAKAALIAASYAALTWISQAVGLGFGAVQLRLSEALTVLPLFTPCAIPGLTLGCALANSASPLGPVDIAVGTAATLLQSICCRALRRVQCKTVPLLSILMPVLCNAVFVGAELAFFNHGEESFFTAFAAMGMYVGLGELVVCLLLALPLYQWINKRPALKNIISE